MQSFFRSTAALSRVGTQLVFKNQSEPSLVQQVFPAIDAEDEGCKHIESYCFYESKPLKLRAELALWREQRPQRLEHRRGGIGHA